MEPVVVPTVFTHRQYNITMGMEEEEEERPPPKAVGSFRRIIPQVLAITAKNLLLLSMGTASGFIMVAIPVLHNAKEGISLDDEQVSWFGSIKYICQPVGNLLCGVLVDSFGRKRSMQFITVPSTVAWLLFLWGQSAAPFFLAVVLFGVCMGMSEAPTKTYAGEVAEPNIRGALMAYSGIFLMFGILLQVVLATSFSLRTMACMNIAVPITTIISITMVPDSPAWLVSKGRIKEAGAALCWLRGWVTPSAIREELEQLIRYTEESASRKPIASPSNNVHGTESACSGFVAKLRELFYRETLLPFTLVIIFLVIERMGTGFPTKVFAILVFTELKLPLGPYWTQICIMSIGIAIALGLSYLIRRMGKRCMAMLSLTGVGLGHMAVGAYAHTAWLSPWGAQLLVIATYAFCDLGLVSIPWMLISEVFPLRTRGMASGLAAAVANVFTFVCVRTFFTLLGALGLAGVYWLFAGVCVFGLVFVYWCLPETEGKALEEIEALFRRTEEPAPAVVEQERLLLTEKKCCEGDGTGKSGLANSSGI